MSYKPSRSFFKIPNTIIDDFLPYIGCKAFAVYAYYARLVNYNEQRAFPSLTTTAKHLHLDKRTVRKCNDILEQFKLIEKTAGGNRKANRYRILKPNLKILDKL